MTVFFTSDTHYKHKGVINFCPWSRGHYASTEEMDRDMIARYNGRVSKDDEVYHLGDFAFAPQDYIKEILRQLNGNIHILPGNHDRAFRAGFKEVLLKEGLVKSFIHGNHQVKHEVGTFVLNHYAMRVWDRSHYGVMHLYGHSHGSLPGLGKSVDVGVDSVEMGEFVGEYMRPFSIQEVADFLCSKDVMKVDHHDQSTN